DGTEGILVQQLGRLEPHHRQGAKIFALQPMAAVLLGHDSHFLRYDPAVGGRNRAFLLRKYQVNAPGPRWKVLRPHSSSVSPANASEASSSSPASPPPHEAR